MNTHLYQIGDRVRLAQPCFGLPAGTVGVITFVYREAHNLYRIYFDSHGIACTVHSSGFAIEPQDTQRSPS